MVSKITQLTTGKAASLKRLPHGRNSLNARLFYVTLKGLGRKSAGQEIQVFLYCDYFKKIDDGPKGIGKHNLWNESRDTVLPLAPFYIDHPLILESFSFSCIVSETWVTGPGQRFFFLLHSNVLCE